MKTKEEAKKYAQSLSEYAKKKFDLIEGQIKGECHFAHSVDEMNSIISNLNCRDMVFDRKYMGGRSWMVYQTK